MDELYQIFLKYLKKPELTDCEQLIYETVGEYLYVLGSRGFIPESQLDNVEDLLSEEVRQMYLKTTYGFVSLSDYKKSQVSQ